MPEPDLVARRERERLRRSFQPRRVRLLFVGESPPASGRFFYRRDSGLYRALRDTFFAADPSLREETFLGAFQAAGCYLLDLCPEPVDHLPPGPRRAVCLAGEGALAATIAALQPDAIATVVRSIEPNAAAAARLAHWNGVFLHLPYPGRWSRSRRAFMDELTPYLATLLDQCPQFTSALVE